MRRGLFGRLGTLGLNRMIQPNVSPPPVYLTQWQIVGNSEVHGQEIWSCGEYSEVDGKYHILVQPQGGSIADIALTEPLRKVNDVADTIEFPSETEGKALVTRFFDSADMGDLTYYMQLSGIADKYAIISRSIMSTAKPCSASKVANALCAIYDTINSNQAYSANEGISIMNDGRIRLYDENYNQLDSAAAFTLAMQGVELIYELETPITELVDAPQIEEADSYSMVISQGGKAVSWGSFTTK